MKKKDYKELVQTDGNTNVGVTLLSDNVWIEQYNDDESTDYIIISKSKLPELIKILQSFVEIN
jgi:hypothetical protein